MEKMEKKMSSTLIYFQTYKQFDLILKVSSHKIDLDQHKKNKVVGDKLTWWRFIYNLI